MESLFQLAVEAHGTPCYLYLLDDVADRIKSVKGSFGGRFEISYAVKANPHARLLRWLGDRVSTLDVSSGGELERAVDAGWAPDRLSFTGPAKRLQELQLGLDRGIGEFVVESVEEALKLDELSAATPGTRQRILVRISPVEVPPGFGVSMAGKATRFGIDEEAVDEAIAKISRLRHLELSGFHIYVGTQCLDPASIVSNLRNYIEIFIAVSDRWDLEPSKLIFGSGIGIPYYEKDESVDLRAIAAELNPALDALTAKKRFRNTRLLLETGRYIVGESGFYLIRVLRIKQSRGARIAICNGGMNHHLAACGHLGTVIHRNYRIFKALSAEADGEERSFEVVGPLCTSIDTLGRGVTLPGLQPGDVLGVHCSGAYGLSASPVNFISHRPPSEVFAETVKGRMVLGSEAEETVRRASAR